MKIFYLAFDDLSQDFAWTIHIREVISNLQGNGHTVDLTAFGNEKPDWLSGEWIPIRRRQGRIGRIWHYFIESYHEIRSAIQRSQPDILYCRGIHLTPTPLLVSKTEGIPLISEINGLLEAEASATLKPIIKWCHQLHLTENAHTITVSDTLKKGLCDLYGADPNKVTVVPNGAKPLPKPTQSKEEIRRNLQIPNRPTLVYVGSFYPHHMLTLLPEVMQRLPDFQIILAGDGPTREPLQKSIDPNRSYFLGAVPHERIAEILSGSDIGIYFLRKPHEHFGFSPIKLFEYMAAGLPVVAGTDLPEIHDFIQDQQVGMSTELLPEDIAEQIKALWEDKEKRRAMGEAGRTAIQTNFSWQQTARSVENILLRHAINSES